MAVAKVGHATALDRVAPQHSLCKGLSCARRFESIALDGFDPGAMKAKGQQSLLDYVAAKPGYAQTKADYRHGFWKHLAERNPKESKTKPWIDGQLAKGGLLWMDVIDEEHAETLGLRVDVGIWPSKSRQARDGEDFVGVAENFATLDGMLALLIMYREAVDRADNLVDGLRQALSRATERFAQKFGLEGEQRHTWEFLVRTRVLRWDPSFSHFAEDKVQAEQELLAERSGKRKHAGQLDSGAPEARIRGRAERRWRRQIMMYACCLSSRRERPKGQILAIPDTNDIQRVSEINEWLVRNRALIAEHIEYAIERCMEKAPGGAKSGLHQLTMPAAVYRRRRRPTNDENAWHAFGNEVPYDFIPVSLEVSSEDK
jgi:hypothetical protein